MNSYAIGDLQGCASEFLRILEATQFDSAKDQVFLLGDLINRGPESVRTLREIKALGPSCHALLGNHDLSVLAKFHAGKTGKEGSALRQIQRAEDGEELLAWLRQQALLLEHENYLMIHAGLPPQWDLNTARQCAREVETVLRGPSFLDFFASMYGDQPTLWDDRLQGRARQRFITNALTRLRYCDKNGELLLDLKSGPANNPQAIPWFAHPQRQTLGKTVLFGHWSTLGHCYRPEHRVWGLDTGCVWGGRLTALHLESQRLIQAPSSGYKKPGA